MLFIFIAMVFYTFAILLGAAASRNMNTNMAAAITNILSAIVPLGVAIPILSKKEFFDHRFGVLAAVLAGISVAIFVMAINKSYAVNKVGIVAPIVFGGAIVLSTLLSALIFKEKITPLEGMGLAVLTVGFGIVIYARVIAR